MRPFDHPRSRRSRLDGLRGDIADHSQAVVPSRSKAILEGDMTVIDAKLLASDRLLDQAWRGGIGVSSANARARALGDPLRCGVVIEDAKLIVSDHHACSPDEALARLVFVSQHTNRTLRDIAHEVVTCAAGQGVEGASTPPVYRFTL
jgi:hypothetical protein